MKLAISITLAAAFFATGFTAFAGEGKIRQASQNLVVVGKVNGLTKFSATGPRYDVIYIKKKGRVLTHNVIPYLGQNWTRSRVAHSGGGFTIRCKFDVTPANYNGGNVVVKRGTTVVDKDPIVLVN